MPVGIVILFSFLLLSCDGETADQTRSSNSLNDRRAGQEDAVLVMEDGTFDVPARGGNGKQQPQSRPGVAGDIARPDASDGESDGSDANDSSSDAETSAARLVLSTPKKVTDENRREVGRAFGGWAPHLRGVMRMDDGSLWMATDTGNNVMHNPALAFYKQAPDKTWSKIGTVATNGTVQQNMAHVSNGRYIYSYGVNVAQRWMESCYFDTTNPSHKACNALPISGSVYRTPLSSNYVGAAIHDNGTQLVWWTVVGASGGSGQFYYIYNSGSGWNGPVVTALSGFNDLAYVYAKFVDDQTVSFSGQGYVGAFPNGNFRALASHFKLGQPIANFYTLTDEDGTPAKTGSDIWIDRKGNNHVFAEGFGGQVFYYFIEKEKPFSFVKPNHTLPSTFRLRLIDVNDKLFVVRGVSGIEVLYADLDTINDRAIDFDKLKVLSPKLPDVEGIDQPSAIWIESSVYQTKPVENLVINFAGKYPESDHQIWSFQLLQQ